MVAHKKIKLAVIISLLTPVMATGVAFSQANTEPEASTPQTLQDRLADRKNKFPTPLTGAQQSRLRGRCKAAQVILGQYQERLDNMSKNRKAAHDKIIDRLNAIVEIVGDRADTTPLKTSIQTLNQKTDDFEAKIASFKQGVSDAKELDCVADPMAFKVTLETIRSDRAELAEAAAGIRTYIKDFVQPLVQSLRIALQAEGENN